MWRNRPGRWRENPPCYQARRNGSVHQRQTVVPVETTVFIYGDALPVRRRTVNDRIGPLHRRLATLAPHRHELRSAAAAAGLEVQ